MSYITHPIADMREHFVYFPETGEILSAKRRRGMKPERVGKSALTLCKNGHFYVKFHGRAFLASRFAWALHYGQWPELEIDHRDGDTCNNGILNLREATSSQQKRNRRPYGRTGVKSVHLHKPGVYRARLTIDRKSVDLGTFSDLALAGAAVVAAEKRFGIHEFRRA